MIQHVQNSLLEIHLLRQQEEGQNETGETESGRQDHEQDESTTMEQVGELQELLGI